MANVDSLDPKVTRAWNIRVSEWQRLKAYSDKTGIPQNWVLSRALTEYLDRVEKTA